MEKTTDYEQRLQQAIDFAIHNGWELFYRPDILLEKVKKAKHVCAFGAGNFLHENFSWFPELDAICKYVCDNDADKWGTVIAGKKCISLDQLKQMDDVVVIISMGDYREVAKQLDQLHIENYPLEYFILRTCDPKPLNGAWFEANRNEIFNAWRLFTDDISRELFVEDFCNRVAPHLAKKGYAQLLCPGQREYFGTDILPLEEDEYFVDAGAYDGDTVRAFINATNNQYGRIYAFELAKDNFERLTENCRDIPREKIELFAAGVSDREREVYIDGSEMGWRETRSGRATARLVSIDTVLADKKISFIKMDIEGSELQALEGCQETIRKQEPKLAICTYHLLADLWKIPLFIKRLNPSYQLYLRHHSKTVWDTVCYAVARKG